MFVLLSIVFFWVIIIGGQYGVGTDYLNYLFMFNNGNLLDRLGDKGEIGFVYFVKTLNYCGFYGQDIFYIIALFWVIALLYFGKNLVSYKYLFIFLFVYITFSSAFNNQMNGIRQYVAVYLFTLSVFFLVKKRFILCVIFWFLARSWHESAIILPFVMLLFCCFKNVVNKNLFYLFLLISIVFIFVFNESWIYSFILSTGLYEGYLDSSYVQEISLINKLTKFAYIPIVIYSIYTSDKYCKNTIKRQFFAIGVYSYCFYLAGLSSSITNRFGMYFTILICIPVAFLLIGLFVEKSFKSYTIFWFIVVYLFLIYGLKVTFYAVGEYEYHSVIFN